MNEPEYILRIILRARDETAAAFKAARQELAGFVGDIDKHNAKLNAFNSSMEKMEKNVGNATDKLREWRALMQGISGDNDDVAKSLVSALQVRNVSAKAGHGTAKGRRGHGR